MSSLKCELYSGRLAADRTDANHRRARRWVALALTTGLALAALSPAANAFSLRVTGPVDAPRMVFNSQMNVASVCLPVTNPANGRSLLYGQRFTDGPVSPSTPAIVLVHGIASSTQDWDFSPTWSVARALASAGYVVFSYDRLGYAKSSYFDHPAGGFTLTTSEHRSMLHDVVGDVKTGGYGITATGSCSGATTPATTKNRSVVVIGHSAGGWVVAGYPGQYHDVAAMIQTDISGSAGGSSASPLGGSSSGGGFTPDPIHPDYFQFFQTTKNCLDFNTYTPGVVQYVAKIACTPPFLDSPYGDIADLGAMYAQNDVEIAMIGPSIPVLLTSGENDTTDPPASANADYDYYKAHCGCNVTQLLLPGTAHLFMVHKSLPTWVDHVVDWLTTRGIQGQPTSAPPTPTRPRISHASLTRDRFRVAKGATAISARAIAPLGTSFRFTLSAKASVTITITRSLAGLARGHLCVTPSRELRRRHARRCIRTLRVGTLTRVDKPRGADRVAFSGRIGNRPLGSGRYKAILKASNASGHSNTARLSFAVVR
jgi:pimeloyl-ACP methyl ester carboxylesterase